MLSSGLTPGISGERRFNVDERSAVARVRCMPLLGIAFIGLCSLSHTRSLTPPLDNAHNSVHFRLLFAIKFQGLPEIPFRFLILPLVELY
jgi:hypothetical protein